MSHSQKTSEEITAAAKVDASTYLPTIPPEIDPARRILKQYSGIAPKM